MCAHTKKRRSRGRREWTLLEKRGALLCAYGGSEGGWRWNRAGQYLCLLVWTCPGDQRRSSRIAADRYRCIYASDYASPLRFLDVHHLFLLLPFLREPPVWRTITTDTTVTATTIAIATFSSPERFARVVISFSFSSSYDIVYLSCSPPERNSRVLVVAKDFRKFQLLCSAT